MIRLATLLATAALSAQAWADTVIATPTAATAPSSTTVDLTNVASVLLSLASAAVLAAIPILIPFVLKRLGVANNADLSAKLATAADAAAGAAYSYALAHEGGLARVDVQNAAVAHGVTYLTSEMQPLLDTLGVTPARASAMTLAETDFPGLLIIEGAAQTVLAMAQSAVNSVKAASLAQGAVAPVPTNAPSTPQTAVTPVANAGTAG